MDDLTQLKALFDTYDGKLSASMLAVHLLPADTLPQHRDSYELTIEKWLEPLVMETQLADFEAEEEEWDCDWLPLEQTPRFNRQSITLDALTQFVADRPCPVALRVFSAEKKAVSPTSENGTTSGVGPMPWLAMRKIFEEDPKISKMEAARRVAMETHPELAGESRNALCREKRALLERQAKSYVSSFNRDLKNKTAE